MVDLGNLGFNGTHHTAGVFTPLHLNNAGHRFGDPIFDDRTLTNFGAHADRGDITYEDWCAIDLFEHNVADIVEIFDEANTTNEITLFIHGHLAAAGVGVITGECAVYVLDR